MISFAKSMMERCGGVTVPLRATCVRLSYAWCLECERAAAPYKSRRSRIVLFLGDNSIILEILSSLHFLVVKADLINLNPSFLGMLVIFNTMVDSAEEDSWLLHLSEKFRDPRIERVDVEEQDEKKEWDECVIDRLDWMNQRPV